MIGANIAKYRREPVRSQAALGEAIGVTFQQIQKYERGDNRVAASRLYRISEVLNVGIAEMFEEEN